MSISRLISNLRLDTQGLTDMFYTSDILTFFQTFKYFVNISHFFNTSKLFDNPEQTIL